MMKTSRLQQKPSLPSSLSTMADFSFFSDTDEDTAVDQVLAEAMDHCVLDQIVAINCSSFSDSTLPSHLESRFNRLKTFPSYNPKTQLAAPDSTDSFKEDKKHSADSPSGSSNSRSGYANSRKVRGELGDGSDQSWNSRSGYANSPEVGGELGDGKVRSGKFQSGHSNCSEFRAKSGDGKVRSGKFQSGHSSSSKFRANLGDGKVESEKLRSGSLSLRSNSPTFEVESGGGNPKRGELRSRSFSSRSSSPDSSTETVKGGCFWCSPKKKSRKKSASRNRVGELGLNWRNDHDEILSDLRSFSSKEQKKLMKKAIKEEEQIIQEAEKIVKWAKQSSSRMDFSLSDDELSDADNGHH